MFYLLLRIINLGQASGRSCAKNSDGSWKGPEITSLQIRWHSLMFLEISLGALEHIPSVCPPTYYINFNKLTSNQHSIGRKLRSLRQSRYCSYGTGHSSSSLPVSHERPSSLSSQLVSVCPATFIFHPASFHADTRFGPTKGRQRKLPQQWRDSEGGGRCVIRADTKTSGGSQISLPIKNTLKGRAAVYSTSSKNGIEKDSVKT